MLRSPFRVDVIRDRGALARIVEDGRIENVYRLQIMNTLEQPQRYRVSVAGLEGLAVASEPQIEVDSAAARWLPVRVQLPPEAAEPLRGRSSPIEFRIDRLPQGDEPERSVHEKSTFLVPR
jgi:polyferredoxin